MQPVPSPAERPGLTPIDLRCEGEVAPLGTDALLPRLSWRLEAAPGARGERQSGFQIVAASRPGLLTPGRADLWDTGRVDDASPMHHPYGGNARPGKRVWWTVRVWDRDGHPGAWAKPTFFEFGLLDPAGAGAKWIGGGRALPQNPEDLYGDHPAPLLRRAFTVRDAPVVRARACFVGLGVGELFVNGHRVGDSVLDPPWTHFGKRIHYAVHDIAPHLRPGGNVVGIALGNGWYNPLPLKMWGHVDVRQHLTVGEPRALAYLEVEYEDGARDTLVTDASWRWSDGPTLRDSLYLGEVHDARREPRGWNAPGFDASSWKPARVLPSPGGALEARPVPPVKAVETVRARAVTQPKPGVWIVDFGVNLTGRIALRVSAPAGTRIALRSGERLYADGTLNPMTAVCGQIKGRAVPPGSAAPSTAWQEDVYVCRGGGEERWSPAFTFHGFRYVEIVGLPEAPGPDTLSAERLRTAVARASTFACSNPLLERIFAVTAHTFESNLVSVQSDCPHREKFGYGGDIVATADTGLFLFDMGLFYAKAVRDFADAARPNGGFTETAPFVGIADAGLGDGAGPVDWGTAHPLLVWLLHRFHGDRRLVEEQYPAAARFFALLESRAKDNLLDNGLGDHETLVPRSTAVTGTAFFHRNAVLMARLSRILGRAADAARYEKRASEIAAAFRARFVDPASGKVGLGSQACQSVALAWDLAGDASGKVLDGLLAAVAKKDHHVETGIFGTLWLLHALSGHGRADVACRIASQTTFPSWGHMLESGATTLWETWKESDNTFSNDHPMFGSVAGWMVQWLAGLQVADDAVGADLLQLRPQPVEALAHARATWRSPRGEVVCGWRRDAGRLEVEAVVPPGASARIEFPAARGARVTEGDRPAERAPGVAFQSHAGGRWRALIGSGTYRFVVGS